MYNLSIATSYLMQLSVELSDIKDIVFSISDIISHFVQRIQVIIELILPIKIGIIINSRF